MASRQKREKLKAQRRAAGLSQRTLAEHVGVTVHTVRAWEQGRALPYLRHHEPLRTALGVPQAELVRLLDPSAPIELNGHRVPSWLSHYDSLVQEAGKVAQVEKVAIPGLLQTRAYAAATEQYGLLPLSEEQVSERVDRREARQAVLHREPEPLELRVLLAETVLLDVLGDDSVMAEQLDHLRKLAELPNVELLLLPADGRSGPARGGFELLSRVGEVDPFMCVTIDVGGPNYDDSPHKVAPFAAMFEHLQRYALGPAPSIRRIEEIQETYR